MSTAPRVRLPVISDDEAEVAELVRQGHTEESARHVIARSQRPKKLADCRDGLRPCPWVSCKWNLLIDVVDEGGIVLNAGHRRHEGGGRVIPPRELAQERFLDELEDAVDWWFDEPFPPVPSCAIDEAMARQPDDNSITLLDEIAEMMYVTRERVRQIEAGALQSLRDGGHDVEDLKELADEMRGQQDERE